jgi:hypothetical protein
MSRRSKLQILIPLVIIIFVGAYGRHRFDEQKSNVVGYLTIKAMDEISGIAASGIVPNLYYIHNDSGDTSRFFAISPTGQLKATIYFKGEPMKEFGVHDCEDIAVGPGPAKGKSYVYLGDIGDNNAVRPFIRVYRFEENPAWENDSITTAKSVALTLKYPDGPRDAETLMIDPIEKLMYIVSKRQDSVTVYTAPLKYKPNDTITLTKRCKLFFPGLKLFKWITAGDISKDGRQVLIKSYVKVYYWKREANEPIWETVKRKPRLLPYIQEKQGEAIGFTPDGKGYYTTSEGVYSPIYYYQIPAE